MKAVHLAPSSAAALSSRRGAFRGAPVAGRVAPIAAPAHAGAGRTRGAPVLASAASGSPKAAMNSQWPTGIPPVMGGHLMASGITAPTSTSTGCGTGPRHMFEYDDGEINTTVTVNSGAADAAADLAAVVSKAAADAIASKGSFTIALSGGSMINALASLAGGSTDWTKWHVLFADERIVALDSDDSNFKGASDAFLCKTGIPATQIYTVDPSLDPDAAAAAYAAKLAALPADVMPTAGGMPVVDLVLLGVGPDGHVASLFPNRRSIAATGVVIGVADSPKPPAARISLSLPCINAAKQVVIYAVGGGKKEIVQRVLEVQALPGALPAQLVAAQQVSWILDEASAAMLATSQWNEPKAYPRSEIPAPAGAKKKSA